MKWQPIETAPTDGTRILLCGRDGKIADGHYGQPDGFANPKRFVWLGGVQVCIGTIYRKELEDVVPCSHRRYAQGNASLF